MKKVQPLRVAIILIVIAFLCLFTLSFLPYWMPINSKATIDKPVPSLKLKSHETTKVRPIDTFHIRMPKRTK